MPASLTFDFVPTQGQGGLIIKNSAAEVATVSEFSFITNTDISGNPWGNLFPYNATIKTVLNPDLNTYTHTITYPTPLSIPVNGQLEMSYTYGAVNGILGLAMPPAFVLAKNNSESFPVPIDNAFIGPTPAPLLQKRFVVYYPSWAQYSEKVNASQIPMNEVNEVIYAFIGFGVDGSVKLLDGYSDGKQLPEIFLQRLRYPYLKSTLSFGGWGLGDNFSAMASNPTALQNFVKNAVAAVYESGATGIDIDWEYPATAEDANNFVTLLTSLRNEFIQQGMNDATISIAAPAGVDKINALSVSQWQQVAEVIDHFNVMTYDYFGAWNSFSDFLAPLQLDPGRDPAEQNVPLKYYNIESTISLYLTALGIDPQKILLGLPAYGRAMLVSNTTTNEGLYQPVTGTPPGEFDDSGVFRWVAIHNAQKGEPGNLPSDMVYQEPSQNPLLQFAQTPIGFSSSKNEFITYEDPQSAAAKAIYMMQQYMGGLMMWGIDGDVLDDDPDDSILRACFNTVQNYAEAVKTENAINNLKKPITPQEREEKIIELAKASSEVVNYKIDKLIEIFKQIEKNICFLNRNGLHLEDANKIKEVSEAIKKHFAQLTDLKNQYTELAKFEKDKKLFAEKSTKFSQDYFAIEKESLALFETLQSLQKVVDLKATELHRTSEIILPKDASRLLSYCGFHKPPSISTEKKVEAVNTMPVLVS